MDNLRLVKGWPKVVIQGEGVLIGTPSIFLRTAGCDLRCHQEAGRFFNCDTPESLKDYDWKKKEWAPLTANAYEMTPDDCMGRIVELDCPNLVITGGEPMLQADRLAMMLCLLSEVDDFHKRHVTIETNARWFNNVLADFVDLPSMSPKLQFWDMQTEASVTAWLDHCAHFGKPAQLKIVCAGWTDYSNAERIFKHFNLMYDVECIVQPATGNADYAVLAQAVIDGGIARLIPQTHALLGLP